MKNEFDGRNGNGYQPIKRCGSHGAPPNNKNPPPPPPPPPHRTVEEDISLDFRSLGVLSWIQFLVGLLTGLAIGASIG